MSAVFDETRRKWLEGGGPPWLTGDFRVICVDAADYIVNLVTHDFLDDVPSIGRVATSGALATKTSTAGVADAADITLTAVTGDQFEYLIIYRHTGVETTSELVFFIDTATGLPFTPNGGDLTIQWDNGANKIARI